MNSGSKESFGEIRNLLLSRNSFERRNLRPSMIRAAGSKHIVENVTIEQLEIDGEISDSLPNEQLKVDHDAKLIRLR